MGGECGWKKGCEDPGWSRNTKACMVGENIEVGSSLLAGCGSA